MLNLVLVDDQPIVLAGLVEILRANPQYKVAGTGSSAEEALDLVRASECDVLVAELNVPGDMMDTIRRIKDESPDTRVLVFTAANSAETCVQALSAGATGFVLKGSSGADICYAIEEVAAGKEFISSSLVTKVLREMRQAELRKAERATISLNTREDQVIRELLNGASNKEIANKLNLSDKTVKHYMTQIMQKFNARNRLEVVLEVQRMNGIGEGNQRFYA
ncbi:response regulator transcription factor [Rhodobacter sp. HX-7-19]|jgi:DNA-binding NarL/FixJ family response regulator|uniref:Response regulator transcription factor n=1 Tax=Paragemmobacter kunshanensis TaxID=2583234 RepID=A0A6M1U483_9RHOB|nr:response regulator transcription factor [Rhodobacter kunshanensis]NGQ89713.1 response regulator transcription factor [Rhodobacter kunshanensis]